MIFLCTNAILLCFFFKTDTPLVLALWASGILWLNIIPVIHYLLIGRKREIFPYMPILGFFIALTYSLPVFFIKPTSYEVADLSETALAHAFFGYSTFYFSYLLFYRRFTFKRGFNVVSLSIENLRVRLLALFFLAVYLFTCKVYTIPSLLYIGATGIYIYFGTTLFLMGKNVRISWLERGIFFFVLVEEFLSAFISGQFAGVALLILYLCIILYISGNGFGKIIFLSALFLMFYYFFAPVKYQYRMKVWFSNKQYTYLEKINLVMELMRDPENYDRTKLPEKNRDRLNLLWRPSYDASVLALVTGKTPAEVPFWNGETYILLPKLVPRIFWPDKPTEDASLKFAIRYRLIPHTKKTSPFPLPILAEMYMNFGEPGIFFGMMLLALLYNFLNGYFNNNNIAGIGKIYSIAIIFSFIYHEGNLTMTFGNIPLLTLSIYLICRVFQSPLFAIAA